MHIHVALLQKLILLGLLILPVLARADTCTPITFAPGTPSVAIGGKAPATEDGGLCYTLAVRPGQIVDVSILSPGTAVGATIAGVGDARDHYHFKAQQKVYTIGVGQVISAERPTEFSMRVTVK